MIKNIVSDRPTWPFSNLEALTSLSCKCEDKTTQKACRSAACVSNVWSKGSRPAQGRPIRPRRSWLPEIDGRHFDPARYLDPQCTAASPIECFPNARNSRMFPVLLLKPAFDRPSWYFRSIRFDTMPSQSQLARHARRSGVHDLRDVQALLALDYGFVAVVAVPP